MSNRQLTEEEREICQKQVNRLEKEVEIVRSDVGFFKYLLDERLRIVYEKQIKENKDQLRKAKDELQKIERNIEILKDQIDNGVPKKENGED